MSRWTRRRRGDEYDDRFGSLGDDDEEIAWDDGGEPPETQPPEGTAEPGSDRVARPVALMVIAGLIVAGLIVDHTLGHAGRATAAPAGPVIPTLAPPTSLSSTWFCPALQATGDGSAKGRIIVADTGRSDVHVTATFTPDVGPPVIKTATVAPYTRTTFRLEDAARAPYAATTVTVDGGGAAVEQEVQGGLGESIAPCATASSDHWYFAAGRTDGNSEMVLSLYNPFPSDAIVDLNFTTDQGPTSPGDYQGLVIPAHTDRVLNIGDHVRSRTAVATTVAATRGRLIVDKLEIESGRGGTTQGFTPYSGLALVLGDTAPGTTWYFPDGAKGPGINEDFEIYNPGRREAVVSVAPTLDRGSADPFQVTVAAGDRVSLPLDTEDRLPPQVGQAWVVTSSGPVVVERLFNELPPAPRTGVVDSLGTPRLSTEWVFAAGSASDGADEFVIVFNPGPTSAAVTVTASGTGYPLPLKGLAPLTLAAGTRAAIRVAAVDPSGIVVLDVTSTAPIAVERSQARVGSPGLSGSIGIAGR